MIIRCLDVETTGLPPQDKRERNEHGIMEIGVCDFDLALKHAPPPWGELVNPGRPTTIEARAVHHISDADVADGISPTLACLTLMGSRPDGPSNQLVPDFFCAHNIDMERAFFGGGEIPWLCTYKAGLRVWPEAPGHKLQELRYWLDIDSEPDFCADFAARPHRAPDDAYVCALVLRRLIAAAADIEDIGSEEKAIERIAKWSKGPALLYMCFMKKHKGKPWAEVAREDLDYLLWIWEKSDVKDRDILATVRYHLHLHGALPVKPAS